MITLVRYSSMIVVILSIAMRAAGDTTADIKRRIIAELPAASSQYSDRLLEYQWTSETVTKDLTTNVIVAKNEIRLRHNANRGLFVLTPDPSSSKDPIEARGVNTRYAFVLRKAQGKDWVLHDFHDLAGGPSSSIYYRGLDQLARGPYGIGQAIWLPDVVAQREFEIREAAEQSIDSRRLIRVTFVFKKTSDPVTHSGYVIFDPERFWLMTEVEHRMATSKNSLTNKTKYEYELDGDFPLHSRAVTIQSSSRFPGLLSEMSSTFRHRREKATESEFTLSAFGLPEPLGVEWESPTRRYVLFLAGGLGFIVLAGILYAAALRRKAKERGSQ